MRADGKSITVEISIELANRKSSYKFPIVHSPRVTGSAADFHYPAPLSNANTMGTAVWSIQEAVANVTQYS